MLDDGTTRISIPLTTRPRQGLESVIASLAPEQGPSSPLLTDRSSTTSAFASAPNSTRTPPPQQAGSSGGGAHPAVSPLGLHSSRGGGDGGGGGGGHDLTPPLSPFAARSTSPSAVPSPVAPPGVLPLPLPLPPPGGGLLDDEALGLAPRSGGGPIPPLPSLRLRLLPELFQSASNTSTPVVSVRLVTEFEEPAVETRRVAEGGEEEDPALDA